MIINRPFPSCRQPLSEGEVKCESTDMKMIFLFTTYFNEKRFYSWPWLKKEGFWNSEMPFIPGLTRYLEPIVK